MKIPKSLENVACLDGRIWLAEFKGNQQQAWEQCPQADWMLWYVMMICSLRHNKLWHYIQIKSLIWLVKKQIRNRQLRNCLLTDFRHWLSDVCVARERTPMFRLPGETLNLLDHVPATTEVHRRLKASPSGAEYKAGDIVYAHLRERFGPEEAAAKANILRKKALLEICPKRPLPRKRH